MRQIREAILSDVAAVMPVVDAARCMMHRSGNVNQWINGYPSASVIVADINRHGGFVVEDDGRVVAYFAFLPAPEPTYAHISPDAGGAGGAWLDGLPYHVIHRLAGLPGVHGIFRSVMDWAFCRTRSIRIDTHRDNTVMQHNLLKHGFAYCGIIFLANGDERLAYQKTV